VDGALLRSVNVIRKRVAPEGGGNATVTAEGQDGIVVQLAGLDASEVKARIAIPAKLTFPLVDDTMSPEAAQANGVPPDDHLLPGAEHPGHFVLVHREVLVSGDGIVDANARYGNPAGGPDRAVDFEFNARGGAVFARITRENIGKQLAIVLDGKVLSAPRIVTEIPGGRGQLFGGFKPEEVTRLALVLRFGPLPAPLTLVEERTIELTARRRE
jgi:protein-export membrane protein SecD